jgi:GNAT superfamily N-acetyltransferase
MDNIIANMNLTDRLQRIIFIAENEMKLTQSEVLTPLHLFIACLLERTGVLGEIFLKGDFDIDYLREVAKETKRSSNVQAATRSFFNVPITKDVEEVAKTAIGYMNHYNQIHLNEGHFLKALVTSKVIDELLTEHNKETILTLGTTARDMITHLQPYTFPIESSRRIRKVMNNDYEDLVQFVEQNFPGWAQTIKDGLLLVDPPIYVAFGEDGHLIGFAAFDVYMKKKCYFGPMGVMPSQRTKGIGYQLLHYCLRDMKEIGYEYAIIGGAGPIEFYEKACNAVVIPAT